MLRLVEQLRRERSVREARGQYVIEGARNFVRCVDHGVELVTVVVSHRLLRSIAAQKLLRHARRSGVECVSVSPEQFRSITTLERASGVMAIVRMRRRSLDEVIARPDDDGCWVALETVRSPGNLGTLLRTMHAVGAHGLIVTGSADPFDPAVVRASVGALFALEIVRTSSARFASWARRHRVPVIGAAPDGQESYDQADYGSSCVLVLGDERSGLSAEQRAACTATVRIPMCSGCDSLNLAVAGSLLLYEARRQHAPTGSAPLRHE